MSAHLDPLPDLPKIRLITQHPTETTTPAEPSTSGSSVDDGPAAIINGNSDQKQENYGDDECRTPKSAEYKIPAILRCPPAPRKPKSRPSASCKRKLMSQLDFFDVVNREEVESFFRSAASKRIWQVDIKSNVEVVLLRFAHRNTRCGASDAVIRKSSSPLLTTYHRLQVQVVHISTVVDITEHEA